MKRLLMKLLVLGMLATFLMPLKARCEFYQYEDENGAINFTDDPAKIPKKFKNKHKTRDDDGFDSSVMRVKIKGNRVLLPVTVCYLGREVKANFILDTGAEVSTVSPTLADRLKLDPRDTDIAFARGIGNGIQVIGHTKLDYLVAGPNRKYEVDVIVVESGGYDGLLGMNFLRDLRYHVDFNTSTIKWGD